MATVAAQYGYVLLHGVVWDRYTVPCRLQFNSCAILLLQGVQGLVLSLLHAHFRIVLVVESYDRW